MGWRLGTIDDVMRMVDRKAFTIAMDDVAAEQPVDAKALLALLPDEVLLDELRRRMASRNNSKEPQKGTTNQ